VSELPDNVSKALARLTATPAGAFAVLMRAGMGEEANRRDVFV